MRPSSQAGSQAGEGEGNFQCNEWGSHSQMQLRRVSSGEGAETEPAESVERQKAQSCRNEVEKVALGEVVHWPVVAPSTVLVHFPLSQPNSILSALPLLM